jgi:hypothetical protein
MQGPKVALREKGRIVDLTWYWYHLAMPGLVLDPVRCSVTLVAPSNDSKEHAPGGSSRGRGKNESF